MGLFFDEKKKDTPAKIPEQHHGFFAAASLMLLAGLLTCLGWICKPLFSWLFDFRDISRELAITKVSIIFVFLSSALFGLWQFQFFRDITLSRSHTLNRNTSGVRIHFPESSYFVTEGNSRFLNLDSGSSKKYYTYSGYTKHVVVKMYPDMCPLVPRNEAVAFASENPPKEAEGFTDSIEYTVMQKLPDLPLWEYFKEYFTHPDYFLKSKSDREKTMVSYLKEGTWGDLERDWDQLFSLPDGYKPFEVRAKFYEHALMCF